MAQISWISCGKIHVATNVSNLMIKMVLIDSINAFRSMHDVCRAWRIGEEVLVERVTSAETRHMDNLTIEKRSKKKNRAPLRYNNR